MPWSVTVNDQLIHSGGPGCCPSCDAAIKWRGNPGNAGRFAGAGRRDPISPQEHAAAASPALGTSPDPLDMAEIRGEHEATGKGYEVTVNPTALQMAEIVKRSGSDTAHINVMSRRDIAAATAESMNHFEIHEALVHHAHPLGTQDRRRLLTKGIGRWRVVGRPGQPVRVINVKGFPVNRTHWPDALQAAIPEGMVIGDEAREAETPEPHDAPTLAATETEADPKDKAITAEPIAVEQSKVRSKSIEDTIDIKFIATDGQVDVNFPPDWTEQQIRNALEESVQLQQSEMYFGNPRLNAEYFARRIEEGNADG